MLHISIRYCKLTENTIRQWCATSKSEMDPIKSSAMVMCAGLVSSMQLTGYGFLCYKARGLVDIEILIIRFEHAVDSIRDM